MLSSHVEYPTNVHVLKIWLPDYGATGRWWNLEEVGLAEESEITDTLNIWAPPASFLFLLSSGHEDSNSTAMMY